MTVLGQGGMPLQVVHVGRRMHYALLLVEVDGEWGARDFILLILRGDRRHRQVHPRRWTRHSTSTTRIIRRGVSGAAWISSGLSVSGGVWVSPGVWCPVSRGASAWAASSAPVCRCSWAASCWASSATASWAAACRGCYRGRGWGLSRGPYELSLLPNFGKHVAFKLWNDKTVSMMIFYYLSIIDLFFT